MCVLARSPTCSSHAQCPLGTFCRAVNERSPFHYGPDAVDDNILRHPRCFDCNEALDRCPDAEAVLGAFHVYRSNETLVGNRPDLDLYPWDAEAVDHMSEWLNPNDIAGALREYGANVTDCLAAVHCGNTDKWESECDYLKLATDNIHEINVVVLCVVALLLAGPLNNDMDQAAIESALLEHGLNQIEKRHEKFDFLKALKCTPTAPHASACARARHAPSPQRTSRVHAFLM